MNRPVLLMFISIIIVFGYTQPLIAGNVVQPDGFGVAKWGMSRNEIVAVEGTPDVVGDSDGRIWYFDKEIMGKKATVVYGFEEGCSSLKKSKCLFSDGCYTFYDASKEFSDELEKILTEKYGAPASVEKKVIDSKESITYIRYVGKVKIKHMSALSCNLVCYYGPYRYEIEKRKAKKRGL